VAVLCNETEINGDAGTQVLNGSATENALVHMALAAGVDVPSLRPIYAPAHGLPRREPAVHEQRAHGSMKPGCSSRVKGNPAEVLALSRWHIRDGVQSELTDEERRAILDENERMAGEALRVLGLAYSVDADESTALKGNLVWLGLVGMADPIREGAPALIEEFHRAGIDTVMITGDQSPTAHAIGRALGLSNGNDPSNIDSTHLEEVDPRVAQGSRSACTSSRASAPRTSCRSCRPCKAPAAWWP
jgi:P-type Ca2+ transporter type 2C